MKLARATRKNAGSEIARSDRWLTCESAIVAENVDPDKLGRIKVIIPSIDEDMMFDDWVVPAASHCMGNGFGMLMIPPKGAEVIVSGVLGQKFNLIYHAAVYNEEMKAPEELNPDRPGFKVPKDFWLIVGELMKVQAQSIEMVASQLAKLEAATIQSLASGENKLRGGTVKIEADGAITINGASVTIQPNGNVTINPTGNVAIAPTGNLTLNGRTVNKMGPAI